MGRYSIIILLFILGACQSHQSHPLEGTWELSAMWEEDSTGNRAPYAGGMQGYIMYNPDGHMALHLSYTGYEKTDLEIDNFNPDQSLENLKYLTGTYHYLAEYTIEEDAEPNGSQGVVVHHRIAHSNPNDWGEIVKRRYTIKYDTLFIKPLESSNKNITLQLVKVGSTTPTPQT